MIKKLCISSLKPIAIVIFLFGISIYYLYAKPKVSDKLSDSATCTLCDGTGKILNGKNIKDISKSSTTIDKSKVHDFSKQSDKNSKLQNKSIFGNLIEKPDITFITGLILGFLISFFFFIFSKRGKKRRYRERDLENDEPIQRPFDRPTHMQSYSTKKEPLIEVEQKSFFLNDDVEKLETASTDTLKSGFETKRVYFRPMGDRKLGPGNGEPSGKNNLYMIYAEIISTSKAKIHLALDMYKTEEVGMYDIIVFQNDKLLNYIDGKGSSGENHVEEIAAGEAELIIGVWTVTKPIKVRFS